MDIIQHLPEANAQARAFILEDLLGEVAFADLSSRANAVALMLLPFLRNDIETPYPLHLIQAGGQARGASYLAKLCLSGAFGRPMAYLAGTPDDLARITRLMDTSHHEIGYLWVKNDGHGQSEAIADALASWRAADLTGRQCAVRVMTHGSGVSPLNAAGRVPITLCPRPDDWFTRDPLRDLKDLRVLIAHAASVLVSQWIAANRPQGPDCPNFPQWSAIIGGILQANNIEGFQPPAPAITQDSAFSTQD